jgi:hypothetical protein
MRKRRSLPPLPPLSGQALDEVERIEETSETPFGIVVTTPTKQSELCTQFSSAFSSTPLTVDAVAAKSSDSMPYTNTRKKKEALGFNALLSH